MGPESSGFRFWGSGAGFRGFGVLILVLGGQGLGLTVRCGEQGMNEITI